METIKLYDVPYGSEIYFPADEEKTHYFVRKTDGMYTQLFQNLKDLENFERPGYVAAWAEVVLVKRHAPQSM